MLNIAGLWELERKGASAADIIREITPWLEADAARRESERRKKQKWRMSRGHKSCPVDMSRGRSTGHENINKINGHVHGTPQGISSFFLREDRKEETKKEKDTRDFKIASERFWRAYPNRKAKGRAEKALYKALKQTSIDVIIAAVERQAPTWKPEFMPYPATWLNDRRWEDEPARRAYQPGSLEHYLQ